MVKWTGEQETAINARNCNLLVTAAAGSGKTAVLVQRVINIIIEDGVDIDKLLIVTFTRAAASEMKERIRKAILEKLEAGKGRDENLRRQINLLNKAQISTLHSFCQSVVKSNFHLADVDPGFKVGDDTEMLLLKTEAIEETFENEYELSSELFHELLEMFSAGKNDKNLQSLVVNIYDFIQSKPEPYQWLQEKTADLAISPAEFETSAWAETISGQIRIQLDGTQELLEKAVDIAEKYNGPSHYLPALENDMDMVIHLKATLNNSVSEFAMELMQWEFDTLSRARNDCDVALREEAKEHRDAAKTIIKNIKSSFMGRSVEELIADLNKLFPYMQYLASLVVKFKENFQARKAEKGVLDFNDLEHYALQILSNDKVADEYRSRFTYVFVDEYQDSNQVQEAIINLVKKDDNLFMVGDVKQSIYRFRLADPTLFMEKYGSFSDDESEIDRRVFLRNNFRSRCDILNAVNFIFKNIMSKDYGEIEYDDDAALYPGRDDNHDIAEAVELIIIDSQDKRDGVEETRLDEIDELNKIQIEAHVVAAKIKQLLKSSVFDPQTGAKRGITYRDIVILLRTTKNWINVFTEVFSEEGIPSYADVNSGYLDAIEISMFINLLKIIDNSRQDIELISVLRSPIFNFQIEELVTIRLSSSEKNFYAALNNFSETGALQQKISSFLDSLHKWQKMAKYLPLEELIWRLMLDSGYLNYVTAMPGGMQRVANIRLLFARARNYQASTMHGLFNFLNFMDQINASQTDIGTAKTLGENDNVVRLMSIHKSKGLEFPVVILSGLGKQFNLTDTNQMVLLHKDLGIGPRFVDTKLRAYTDTIVRNAIKEKIKFENLSEEMRILYVACTRAKEKLIMTGTVANIEKSVHKWSKTIAPYNLAQARSGLDWFGSVLMRHEDGNILREQLAEPWEEKETQDKSHWEIEIINKNNIKLDIRENALVKEDLMQNLTEFNLPAGSLWQETITKRLNWIYPDKTAGQIPAKLSVTQIQRLREKKLSNAELNIPVLISRPNFKKKDKKLSGMEKGTIFHFVLQHLDLKRVQSSEQIRLQIDELVAKQLLQPEEAEALDISIISDFYQSEIGQRVLKSDTVKRETPFNLMCKASEVLGEIAADSDEELMVQGVIDLYFIEDDEIVLVDYKTDYITPENRETKVNSYRIQIALYKNALESILQKKVKQSYLFLLDSNEAVRM